MDLLWPEAAPDAARNNLNVAVHGLRKFLRSAHGRDDHVRFQNDGYVLNPDFEWWIDIDEFHRHASAGQRCRAASDGSDVLRELETAETLYRGSLFADDLYEEWTIGPRRAVEDHYVRVLRALAEHYREAAADEACIRVIRKVLEVQPADENAHRDLMRIYTRVGQHHLAVRQYRDCARALEAELDVGPGPETVRLYEDLCVARSI